MSDLNYLTWRGSIIFAEGPFYEVENLLLAELAYITLAPNSRKFAQKIHIHIALLKLAFPQGVLRFRALPEYEFFSRSVSYFWAPE